MSENEILLGVIEALQDPFARNTCKNCTSEALWEETDPYMHDTGVCDECGDTNDLIYKPLIALQQKSGMDEITWCRLYPRISRRKNKK